MSYAHVSDKGQITLPADIRRKLGIKAKSRVDVEMRDNEIIIRPIRSVREVRGIFHEAALQNPADWEIVRLKTERSVAEEVVDEDG